MRTRARDDSEVGESARGFNGEFWTRFRDGCDLFELGVFDRFTVAVIYTVLEIKHFSEVAVYWLQGRQQEDGKEQRRLFR